MKLIPASSARWIVRIPSSWSGVPQAPNIIAPRHSGLTWTPVRPSSRYSIDLSLVTVGAVSATNLHNSVMGLVEQGDAERLRRLQTITDAALSHLELGSFLDTLLLRTREALGVDTCAVLDLDESHHDL